MKSNRRAFTLIELLVVIAILAAILFPVFAQAKAAAKKTAELSQIKQVATGMQVYLSDADDTYPLTYAAGSDAAGQTTWYSGINVEFPIWLPGQTATYYAQDMSMWANSTQAYIKNEQMLKSVAGVERVIAGAPYTTATKTPGVTNFQMNGTLNSYNATAINSPAQLMIVSQNRGTMNIKGYASANPCLSCPTAGACVFVPSSTSCNGANGTSSQMLYSTTYSQWIHSGKSQVAAYADGHAKSINLNAAVGQKSDYRTNFWTRYTASGASGNEWQDTNFCHTLLFQPNFDFQTFGTPIEY